MRRIITEFLAAMALRQVAIAVLLWTERDRYEAAASFIVMLSALPMIAWVVLWSLSGLAAVVAIASRRVPAYIVAIIGCAMLTGYWTAGFIFASAQVRDASKLLVILFATFTLKDLLLLRATLSRAES